MELSSDWKAFDRIFTRLNGTKEGQRVARTAVSHRKRNADQSYFLVVDKNKVVHSYSPLVSAAGLLHSVVGKSLEDAAEILKEGDLFWIEAKAMHKQLSEAMLGTHFFDQTRLLGKNLLQDLRPYGKQRKRSLKEHVEQNGDLHFFLQSALGSWKRFFPQSYGIYLRLEAQPRAHHIFIHIQNGKICSFYQPEFQGLPSDRRQPEDLVRYLGEKHGIKVVGFYAPASEWWSWSETKNPWAAFYSAYRSKKLRIVPANLTFKSWLAAQATLGKA